MEKKRSVSKLLSPESSNVSKFSIALIVRLYLTLSQPHTTRAQGERAGVSVWSLQVEERSSSIAFILIVPFQPPCAWNSRWQGPCGHTVTQFAGQFSQTYHELSVLEGPEVRPVFFHHWSGLPCPR